jgi:hypothetical protein
MHVRFPRITPVVLVAIGIVASGTRPATAQRPAFDVKANYVKRDTMIAMRDGVKLFTILYTPRDTTRSYPIMLVRESVPMEDYEVRDVLNRAARPVIEPRIGYMEVKKADQSWIWSVPIFVTNEAMVVAKDTSMTVEFLDATANNQLIAEKFVIKTQAQPIPHEMYIASFDEAIHRGLNKYFGTFWVTMQEPQSLQVRMQLFSNGMRAKWWLVKLNFGETSATLQVLDEGYLY